MPDARATLFIRHDRQPEIQQHVIARALVEFYVVAFYISMFHIGAMAMRQCIRQMIGNLDRFLDGKNGIVWRLQQFRQVSSFNVFHFNKRE